MIYFWRSIRTTGLPPEYIEYAVRLKNGEGKSLHFKKLRGSNNLYAIRTDRETRLLFVNYHNHLIFIGIIKKHNYDGSPFLQPQILKRFMADHAQEYDKYVREGIHKDDFESVELDLEGCNYDESEHNIDFYDGRFIELDAYQNEARIQSLPLLICGLAGTGKSFIGLKFLAKAIEQGREGRMLYVTQSRDLARRLAAFWKEIPIQADTSAVDVRFLSLIELIEEQFAEKPHYVDHNHTKKWVSDFLKKQIKRKKNLPIANELLEKIDEVYEEFRIIAASDQKQYLAQGGKTTLLDKALRPFLWSLFESYQEALKAPNLVHMPFYRLPATGEYALIIGDEIQDFPLAISTSLLDFAAHQQVCYCGSGEQTLATKQSVIPILEERIKKPKGEKKRVDLLFPHRCPATALQLNNVLTELRWRFAGGKNDKSQHGLVAAADMARKPRGELHWIHGLEQAPDLLIPSPNRAFITTADQVNDLQQLCNTALVFTPSDIRGFEFNEIVIYNLFNETVSTINKKLPAVLSRKSNTNRAKPGEKDTEYESIFSELHIAVTRSMNITKVVQPRTPENNAFLSYLEKYSQLDIALEQNPGLNAMHLPKTLTWEEQMQHFLQENRRADAIRIYEMHIKKDNVDFETYIHPKPTEATTPPAVIALSKTTSTTASTATTETTTTPRITRRRKKKKEPLVGGPLVKSPHLGNYLPINDEPKIAPSDYLKDLIDNFSSAKITKLVNHHNFWRYLLCIPFNNFDCLLMAISANNQFTYQLEQQLHHLWMFAGMHLTTPIQIGDRVQIPLEFFLSNNNTLKILSGLFAQVKSTDMMSFDFFKDRSFEEQKFLLLKISQLDGTVLQKINFNALFEAIRDELKFVIIPEDESFLSLLSTTVIGQIILTQLLFKSSQVIMAVAPLLYKLRKTGGVVSIFYQYTSSEKGILHLRKLSSVAMILHALKDKIDYHALFDSALDPEYAETAFLRLCHSSEGQNLLVDLLQYRVDILKKMTAHDLFGRSRNQDFNTLSAFELLVSTNQHGIALLRMLIGVNLGVFAECGKALATPIADSRFKKAPTPLHYLVFRGSDILLTMIIHHEKIIPAIPVNVFFMVIEYKDQTTTLWTLLDKHPKLKETILEQHALLRVMVSRRTPTFTPNASSIEIPFFKERTSPGELINNKFDPQFLFERSYQNKLAYIEAVLADDYLTQTYVAWIATAKIPISYYFTPIDYGENQGFVPFCFFTKCANGLSLLHYLLLKDEQQLEYIDHLLIDFTSSRFNTYNWPIRRLVQDPIGLSILSKVMDLFPQRLDILKSIHLTQSNGPGLNILSSLSCLPEGVALLTRLIKRNPQLIQNLHHRHLMGIQLIKDRMQTCIFSQLVATPGGLPLLVAIINENPTIINAIGKPQLFSCISFQSKRSAFVELINSCEGIALLHRILQQNRVLAHDIKGDDLALEAGDKPTTLHKLIKTTAGWSVCKLIQPKMIFACLLIFDNERFKDLMQAIFESECRDDILYTFEKSKLFVISDFKNKMALDLNGQTIKSLIKQHSPTTYRTLKTQSFLFFSQREPDQVPYKQPLNLGSK